MTRTIRAAVAAAILTSGLGSIGCVSTGTNDHATAGDVWRKYNDPCYPERYNHAARQATVAPFAQQVHNGQVLNQTIFTYHFETDPVTKEATKLTTAGMEKLNSIARTRPVDTKLYIQAAMDLQPTPETADKILELRAELDAKRGVAIQKYLATVPTYAPVSYEIFVHNPATPGINAEFGTRAYNGSAQGYTGTRGGSGGGTTSLGTGGGSSSLTAPPTTGGTTGGTSGGTTPR